MIKANNLSISLVLGSGGVRGYAHIGVIEELLQHGYEMIELGRIIAQEHLKENV